MDSESATARLVAANTPAAFWKLLLDPEPDPSEWRSAATYTLEMAVKCPHCDEPIRTIRVVGLTRSQVAFTSTLPRKGRVAVCPECERILPVELAGPQRR